MRFSFVLTALLACGLWAAPATAADPSTATTAAAIAKAADAFLATLPDDQKETATFEFDDAERFNWHYVPKKRQGLALRDTSVKTQKAAFDLLKASLSDTGYIQASKTMTMEGTLFLLEAGETNALRERRDPLNYSVSIFGKPGASGNWGWRIEGHHLSLNYTIKDGEIVSTTPEFFGINPADFEAGPDRGLRVLGNEEDLARALAKTLTDEQKSTAWINKEALGDITSPSKHPLSGDEPKGIAASKMTDDQKAALQKLIDEYLKNMPEEVANVRRAQIQAAGGLDPIHFAWWGSVEKYEPHHYRVVAPTFVIEYNNIQNNANHIHSVWRSADADFGQKK